MLSLLCLHDVMTSWRDVMTSQNLFLLYQLVDVLKWWYTCISVYISVDGFQVIIVYVFAWCLHVITWRHDVIKFTTWHQETNCFISACKCAREQILFSFLWLLWWLNSTWLLSSYLHDEITSGNYVIKHAVPISACRRAREMILFFVSIVLWVAKFKNIIDFVFSYMVISQSDAMTSWHGYMTSQN